MSVQEIYSGDATAVIRVSPEGHSGPLSGDWVCTTVLKNTDGNDVFEPRPVSQKTPEGDKFLVALSPDETALVESSHGGFCDWAIKLENRNATPPFALTKVLSVKILPRLL